MRRLSEVASRLARRGSVLAEAQWAWAAVFVTALAVWWVQAVVIPLDAGRDLGTYLGAYVQLFQVHAIDLGYVLGRTPISPVVAGGLLDLWGGALAEPAMSLLYAGSIVAWFLAGRRFGGLTALLVAIVLLAHPGYGILFHELSSDAIFAAAFAGWSLVMVRVVLSPTPTGWALAGGGVGILALIRPGNQALLVLALVPLLIGARWRTRLLGVVAFVAPAVVLLGAWSVHNGVRYGEYTVARGGNQTVPFFRAFVTDKIVRPSNGPASRDLAQAVEERLLTEEPYRSYHISLEQFFSEASPRMQEDLVALSDRVRGWDSDRRWLRDVGVEAVLTHPWEYSRGVGGTIWGLLTHGLFRPLGIEDSVGGARSGNGGPGSTNETILVGGVRLPKPTEGEPIPAPHEGGIATRDGSIYTVWTSPIEHHVVFMRPGDRARNVALHQRMEELASRFPERDGSVELAHRLNQASRWYPQAALWLAIGVAALAVRRPRHRLALSTPALAAFIVIVLSALGLPAEPHYALPVAPAFVLLGLGALLAPKPD